MDAEFLLTLASESWLKWFCCPHCGNDYTISKNGLCNECNEQLVLVKNSTAKSNIINGFSCKLNSIIPGQIGLSHYYHAQWNQLSIPVIELDHS